MWQSVLCGESDPKRRLERKSQCAVSMCREVDISANINANLYALEQGNLCSAYGNMTEYIHLRIYRMEKIAG